MTLNLDYDDINFTIDTLRRALEVYNKLDNKDQTNRLFDVIFTQRNLHSLVRHYYYWTPDYVSWKQFTFLRDILYLPKRVTYDQVRATENIDLVNINTDTQVMLSILLKFPKVEYYLNKIVYYINHDCSDQHLKDNIHQLIRHKISPDFIERINTQIDALEQVLNLITGEDEMVAIEGSTEDVVKNILSGTHSIDTEFLLAMLQEYTVEFWNIWESHENSILQVKPELPYLTMNNFCELWNQQFYDDGVLKSVTKVDYILTDFLLLIQCIPLMDNTLYNNTKESIHSIIDHVFWKHDTLDNIQQVNFNTDKNFIEYLWDTNTPWKSDTVKEDFLNYILVSAQNYIPLEYQQEVINIIYDSNKVITTLKTKHIIAIVMNLIFQIQ